MGTTRTERRVAAPVDQVYQIVADIESYPQFVPACTASKIISTSTEGNTERVEAELAVSFGPLRKTFATRNINTPNTSIQINLHSGPLRQLEGLWLFHPIDQSNTLVSCEIKFHLGGNSLNKFVEKALRSFANQLSDAFIKRATACHLNREQC